MSAPLQRESKRVVGYEVARDLLTSGVWFRQDRKVLLALNIRRVQDLNEITSHMMEVVQAHMQLFGQVCLACLKGAIIVFFTCRTPAAPVGRSGRELLQLPKRFPWQPWNFLFIQAYDVNMNPTAGPGAEGVLPNGLSTVQGEVSGFNGRFGDAKVGTI